MFRGDPRGPGPARFLDREKHGLKEPRLFSSAEEEKKRDMLQLRDSEQVGVTGADPLRSLTDEVDSSEQPYEKI
jgi:hypothetical protein